MLEKPDAPSVRDPLHLSAPVTPDVSQFVDSERKLTTRHQSIAKGDCRVLGCADRIRLAANLRSAWGRSGASAVTGCRALTRRHVAECARRELDGHG